MRETKHTPEPWHQGVYDNPKRLALAIFSEGHDEVAVCDTVETARRIVACVNACAGFDDPKKWIDECERQRDEYKAQRDELLAALKEVIPMVRDSQYWPTDYEKAEELLKKYDHA